MTRWTLAIALAATCAAPAAMAARPQPDLIVTSVSGIPSEAVGGTPIPIRDTVVNRGTATARASRTDYYLSFDEVRSPDDILLTGARKVKALKAGRSSRGRTTVTLPSNVTGVFDVIACADGTAKVREENERDNCKVAARSISIHLPPPANQAREAGAARVTSRER